MREARRYRRAEARASFCQRRLGEIMDELRKAGMRPKQACAKDHDRCRCTQAIALWRYVELGLARATNGCWPKNVVIRSLFNIEPHALCERKLHPEIDRVGGATHIGLPCVGASLATTARLLFATKGTPDLGS
jgi:hypothetical protein